MRSESVLFVVCIGCGDTVVVAMLACDGYTSSIRKDKKVGRQLVVVVYCSNRNHATGYQGTVSLSAHELPCHVTAFPPHARVGGVLIPQIPETPASWSSSHKTHCLSSKALASDSIYAVPSFHSSNTAAMARSIHPSWLGIYHIYAEKPPLMWPACQSIYAVMVMVSTS
jgi:hypothetical protein